MLRTSAAQDRTLCTKFPLVVFQILNLHNSQLMGLYDISTASHKNHSKALIRKFASFPCALKPFILIVHYPLINLCWVISKKITFRCLPLCKDCGMEQHSSTAERIIRPFILFYLVIQKSKLQSTNIFKH